MNQHSSIDPIQHFSGMDRFLILTIRLVFDELSQRGAQKLQVLVIHCFHIVIYKAQAVKVDSNQTFFAD